MHNILRKRFATCTAIGFLIFSTACRATSEYDMYRPQPQPVPAMVLLDLSQNMGCAPGYSVAASGQCQSMSHPAITSTPLAENNPPSRLDIIRQAFSDYAASNEEALHHLGLATFGHNGGIIQVPLPTISGSSREAFLQTLDAASANQPPSLLGALLAVGHYVSGQAPLFGRESDVGDLRYQPPSEMACAASSNSIPDTAEREMVLLISQDMPQTLPLATPVGDVPLGVWMHRFLTGNPSAQGFHSACSESSESGSERCALALTERLYGHERVRLSVVAIGHESDFLAALAAAGGGRYYTVDNSQDLQVVLEAILPPRVSQSGPAIQPVMSQVIPMQTTDGQNAVLTTQFQTMAEPHWLGNVKRYRLRSDENGLALQSEGTSFPMQTCGERGTLCIDSYTRSEWTQSTRPDGRVVSRGGIADTRPSLATRTIWALHGQTRIPLRPVSALSSMSSEERQLLTTLARAHGWSGTAILQDIEHPLVAAALARYNAFAGVDAADAQHEALRTLGLESWQHRSQESDRLGAIVFGTPVLVTYQAAVEQRRKVLWWSGTDGFLHAIDADTGEWLSSVLLESVMSAMVVAERERPHDVQAGLDTSWVALQHDHNQDGTIRRADGDYVYLYGGLRRSGNEVIALDVTEPEAPHVLFSVTNRTPGFDALAQAWSSPILARLRLPGQAEPQTVVIFGGGYDQRFEIGIGQSAPACVTDTVACGAAIFVVQASGAEAGRLLWTFDGRLSAARHTHVPAMTSPITAPVRAMDIQGDGVVDVLYALDIEGRIFRISLPAEHSPQASLRGDLIAMLGNPSPGTDNAFFQPLAVAMRQDQQQGVSITLATGSGRLPQPLSIQEKGTLYILEDFPLAPPARIPIDVSSPDAIKLSAASPEAAIGKRLWILPLRDPGEKLVAPPLILNHQAFFLSYVPPVSRDLCSQTTGTQRLWALDTRNARPLLSADGHINSPEAVNYAGELQPATVTRLSALLMGERLYLMQGLSPAPLGVHRAAPERVRWQQVLTGPRVRSP